MTDTEILCQMIKDTARVPLQNDYGKPFVELAESKALDSSATIHNVPSDVIVIKVDAFQSPDSIFCGKNGECKRADYVIVSTEAKRILYVEIKRRKDSWDQIVKQLTGAECFVKYCREIGKSFWKKATFLEKYEHRFISILL